MREKEVSLRKRYLLFYLLVGLIPIVIFSFIYWFGSIHDSREEIARGMDAGTHSLLNSFDYLLQGIDGAASELSNYIYSHRTDDGAGTAGIMPSILVRYEEILGNGIRIFYYDKGGAEIYASEGVMPYSQFDDLYLHSIPVSDVPFFTLANRVSSPLIRLSEGFTFLFYAVPEYEFIPQSSLIFMVDNSYLASYVEASFGALPVFYEYAAGSGRVVFSNIANDGVPDGFTYSSDAASTLTQNRLSCLFSPDEVLAPYHHDMAVYFFFMSVIIIIILLLSFYLSRLSYDPIGKLISSVMGTDVKLEGNELAAIEKEWVSVKNETGNLEEKIEQQASVLLGMIMRNLLGGRLSGTKEEIEYFLSLIRWTLVFRNYQVVSVGFTDLESESPDIFESMLREINEGERRYYPVRISLDDKLRIVIGSSTADAAGNLEAVNGLLHMTGNKGYTMGGSRITDDLLHLNVAYLEAVLAEKESPADGFSLYEEGESRTEELVISRSDANLFTQAVRSADANAAHGVVDRQLASLESSDHPPLIRQSRLYDILNMVIRAAADTGISGLPYSSVICDVGHVDRFYDEIGALIDELVERRQAAMEKERTKEKNEMIAFVDDNFRNSQMSLAYLSSRFGRSVSYLSRLFKAEMDKTFIDYLTQLRISWICDELRSTDRPIRDIVSDSGYFDISGAMRRFKAVTGVTMSQWREEHSR